MSADGFAALAALMGYFTWIVEAAKRRGVPASDAEDFAQDTLLSAARTFHTLDASQGPEVVRAWLRSIVARRAARFRRMAARRLTVLEIITAAPPADARHDMVELLLRLRRATTPPRWRAWFGHDIEGFTAPELAAIEGVKLATVETRIRLARLDLAAALKRDTPRRTRSTERAEQARARAAPTARNRRV